MTENKRFELDKYDCIYDNDSIAKDGGRETYWLIEYIQQKKLVEKMNKLADENKELKAKNEELKSQREDFKRGLSEKDKEIMKLKKENNKMMRILND